LNLLDLLIIATAGAAAYGGYRLGFLARIFSWAGLAVGALVADRFLPDVVAFFSASDPQIRLIAAISFLVGAAMLGQGIGLAVGSLLHAALPLGAGLRQGDRVAGSVLGVVGVMAAVWVLTPALSAVPGWPAEATRGSAIAHMVEDVAPAPPDTMQALRRFVQDGTFPAVFNELRRSPDPGPPPSAGLEEAIHQRVVQSTVKVTGEACRRIQEGSGFVAMPNMVVTNAHVVAGEDDSDVVLSDGSRLDATVVAFDPARDLAILRTSGADRPALPLRDAEVGTTGGVFGFPGGGPLEVSPFQVGEQITAVGTDIYDASRSQREVLVLAADLAPGDSGGALVDTQGQVVGVAFAIAPDRPSVAYALAVEELAAVLAGDLSQERDTGNCLV
jgi:S1-C subfamily serine protease